MGKYFFAKYNMTSHDGYNYFSLIDPDFDDSISITKNIELPRFRKQLTSPVDFSQIQYGDAEINISLLNTETSLGGQTIREFFESLHKISPDADEQRCLCIIDSGRTKWAGFVYLPVEYNYTYTQKEGFVMTLKVYDAMVEWKAMAEKRIFENAAIDSNIPFRSFMQNYVLEQYFMYFSCNFIPYTRAGNGGVEAVFNTRLYAMLLGGQNDNFSTYSFVKGICQEWGLVYRFEVPDNYDSYTAERIPLTFRIMQRSEGNPVTVQPISHIRTQMPKLGKPYVLLLNRRYTMTNDFGNTSARVDIGHGVLISKDGIIKTEDYTTPVPVGTTPENCFIFSFIDISGNRETPDQNYTGKLSVQLGYNVTQRFSMDDVYVVNTDMYKIYTERYYSGDPDTYATLKFGIYPAYVPNASTANVVTDNKISASRLFCESYSLQNNHYMKDTVALLNENRANALKIFFKNTPVIKGEISLIQGEPDLHDYFTVEFNGATETHSITGIEPDNNSLIASYETVYFVN